MTPAGPLHRRPVCSVAAGSRSSGCRSGRRTKAAHRWPASGGKTTKKFRRTVGETGVVE